MKIVVISLAYSALAFGLYRLLWARLPYFRFHRCLLLGIPMAAILVYLLGPMLAELSRARFYGLSLAPEWPVLSNLNQMSAAQTQFTNQQILIALYCLGLSIAAWRLLRELRQLWALTQKRSALPELGPRIYRHHEEAPAFNFAQAIFLPPDWQNDEAGGLVLAHEKAHRRLGHSYDNLYYRLLRLLFWFNPFLVLLHRELQAIHEYQADSAAAGADTQRYSAYLLGQSLGLKDSKSLNLLGVSPFLPFRLIKSRIQMLQQTVPPRQSLWRYLGLAPILYALGLLFSPALPAQSQESALKIIEADIPPRSEACLPLSTTEEALQCFQAEWMRYIQENFKAPKSLQETKLAGTCYVGFVVNTKGGIEQVEVLRGLAPKDPGQEAASEALNQYLVDFFKARAAFAAPAEKDNQAVAIQFVIPINIALADTEKERPQN